LVEKVDCLALYTLMAPQANTESNGKVSHCEQRPAGGGLQTGPVPSTAVQSLMSATVKPRWRGVLHSYACAAMLSAGAILVLEAQTSLARVSALVYVSAAAFQFFISALYHTQHWGPGMHKVLQRIDHSAIYG